MSSWKIIINNLYINFQLEPALSKIYSYLQRLAVGLEQVVLDQAVYDGDFIQEFNEAEYKLKAVSDILYLRVRRYIFSKL